MAHLSIILALSGELEESGISSGRIISLRCAQFYAAQRKRAIDVEIKV